jgi:hypothetical protein
LSNCPPEAVVTPLAGSAGLEPVVTEVLSFDAGMDLKNGFKCVVTINSAQSSDRLPCSR